MISDYVSPQELYVASFKKVKTGFSTCIFHHHCICGHMGGIQIFKVRSSLISALPCVQYIVSSATKFLRITSTVGNSLFAWELGELCFEICQTARKRSYLILDQKFILYSMKCLLEGLST